MQVRSNLSGIAVMYVFDVDNFLVIAQSKREFAQFRKRPLQFDKFINILAGSMLRASDRPTKNLFKRPFNEVTLLAKHANAVFSIKAFQFVF